MTRFVEPYHARFLRVGLLESDRALAEWADLRPEVDLDTLWDRDAIRLLPLVYRALVTAGADDPSLGRLKGVMRRAWYDNQVLFHRVGSALEALEGAGVRAMLLKGVPLALECYPEIGLRPMVDADILVEPHRAAAALEAMTAAGWPPVNPVDRPETRPYGEQMVHQVACVDSNGSAIDLHWRYVPWVARDGSGQDPGLWSRARPITVVGHRALAPGAEDLLLLVLLHAYRAGWATTPRWVADVTFLVRAFGETIDWDLLVTRAIQGHLVLPVRDGLEYVWAEFDAPIPNDVLFALARVKVGRWERRRHEVASRETTGTRRPLVGELGDARIGWARWSLNLTPSAAARSLPSFVTRRLGLDEPRQLPGAIAGRAWRNARALYASPGE
ncbi:MAG TPA: nucleotidyltransferase family protein [Acidimicrobiia bacterium]|nr:nucleotidyltransferase family protein [Acidimicrobiia bacterium]